MGNQNPGAQLVGLQFNRHNQRHIFRAALEGIAFAFVHGMEAMRDLTEQVHGLRLNAQTTIREAVVIDDSLAATVSGSIRGARTVRITPTSTDTYEVVLALDKDTVAYILRVAGSRL